MKLKLLLIGIVSLAFSFAQSVDEIVPQLGFLQFPRSEMIRIGFKFGKLTDVSFKPSNLASGRILLWVSESNFADNRTKSVRIGSISGAEPRPNFGNLALEFFGTKTNLPQAILFYEGRLGRPVSTLDIVKVKNQFSKFSIFIDKDDLFSERDIVPGGTFQSEQGLYLVENNVVRCRFLGLGEKKKYVEKIALEFINTGKISKCPLELIKNDKLESIKPSSVIVSVIGNEYKFNANNFKLTRISHKDGSYNVEYANEESAPRFILENIIKIAKKYNLNIYALLRNAENTEKMRQNFPNLNFITDEDDVLWSNLNAATIFVNKKGKITSSLIILGVESGSLNSNQIENFFKDAR